MPDVREFAGLTLTERVGVQAWRVQRMPGSVAPPSELPAKANTVSGEGPWALWLGPAEWLRYAIDGPASAMAARVHSATRAGSCVATDVSQAMTAIDLSGAQVVELLATDCPLDLEGGAVPRGACAQSHFHQVPILLHRPRGADLWRLFVDVSMSRYLRDSLCSRHEVRHLRPR